MSIDDRNIIDFMSIERGRAKIVLAISDHREWSQPLEHVYALQEKMNTYAAFVESGQVWESASEQCRTTITAGSIPIEIKVFVIREPPIIFFDFMDRAREALATLGISVTYEVRPA